MLLPPETKHTPTATTKKSFTISEDVEVKLVALRKALPLLEAAVKTIKGRAKKGPVEDE
jgi:hypothetical protein